MTNPTPTPPHEQGGGLLPCPFCGGNAMAEHYEGRLGNWRWSVGCTDQQSDGTDAILCYGYQSLTDFATKKEAVAAWNCRAPTPDLSDGWRTMVVDFAVNRWNAEVLNRPLRNVHRRTLDDAWRQVIRFAGGNADVLLGPAHDELLDNPGIGRGPDYTPPTPDRSE